LGETKSTEEDHHLQDIEDHFTMDDVLLIDIEALPHHVDDTIAVPHHHLNIIEGDRHDLHVEVQEIIDTNYNKPVFDFI